MKQNYILALDQGTTSSRALLFDRQGSVVASAQREFPQYFPKPGWVEHDPLEIWASQLQVARECLQQSKIRANELAAIGITNQRETAMIWDRKTGEPLGRAIVWQDRRTAPFCDELRERGLESFIREKTGLVIDAYFSGSKIKWMLDHIKGARQRAEKAELAFGTVDSWLVWKLSGGSCHVTDVSNASRTMLFDIHRMVWDQELLDIMGIPVSMMPRLVDSSEVFAHTRADLFDHSVPIGGMAGDQQAALFGQACFAAGMVKNTYGTGCFILKNTGDKAIPSKNKLLTTIAWKIGSQTTYALEGSIFMAGAVVQWLRDGLGIIDSSSEIEALARQVEDSGELFFVPSFTGLGAPHWDAYARGLMIGINRGTTRAHIARAALEGIASQTMDVLHAMKLDSGMKIPELRVDGGASANNLLMQFQADLLNTPVIRPKNTETTAMGAAALAGLACGFWSDTNEIESLWQTDVCFEPGWSANQIMQYRNKWDDALNRARSWSMR